MNWIDTIKVNIPEHLSHVEKELDMVMTQHKLTEEEAHGVALAAAIAAGDTGLAFEISMNGPLFKSPLRELASIAAIEASKQSIYNTYLYNDNTDVAIYPAKKFDKIRVDNERMFAIFSLSCAMVYRDSHQVASRAYTLKHDENLSDDQIHDIVSIASVIGSMVRIAT